MCPLLHWMDDSFRRINPLPRWPFWCRLVWGRRCVDAQANRRIRSVDVGARLRLLRLPDVAHLLLERDRRHQRLRGGIRSGAQQTPALAAVGACRGGPVCLHGRRHHLSCAYRLPWSGQPVPVPSRRALSGHVSAPGGGSAADTQVRHGRDRAGLIDALILTAGLGLLSWIFLINPGSQAPQHTTLESVTSVAYPLFDVLVFATAARLVTAVRRTPAVGLLAVGGVALFVSRRCSTD